MLRDHRLRSCGATGRLWWFQCCKHGLPSTGWLGQSRSQKGWPWDIYLLNLSEFIHFAWGSCSFIESVFIYIHAPLEKIPILQPRSIYNFCTFSAPRSDCNKEEAVTSVFRFHNFYYPLDIAVEQEPPLVETIGFSGNNVKNKWSSSFTGWTIPRGCKTKIVGLLVQVSTVVSSPRSLGTCRQRCKTLTSLLTPLPAWWRGCDVSQRWASGFKFPRRLGTWIFEIGSKTTRDLQGKQYRYSIEFFADWIPNKNADLRVPKGVHG